MKARKIKAKYDGVCGNCGYDVHAGDMVWWDRQGVTHGTDEECRDAMADAQDAAVSLQEQQMERWAEARFAGTTYCFWENEDYLRSHGEGGY